MKKILTFLALVLANLSFSQQNNTHTLTVKITGIEGHRGVIEIGLYRNNENFAEVGKTYRIVRLKVEGSTLIHEFKNLEQGNYAACLFHDENNNKVCDRNFFGIPTEAYAFSKNIRPKFSVPDFYDCSTKLDKNKTLTIKMIY